MNTAIDPDDGNACTEDTCDPGSGVMNTAIDPDDDQVACTDDVCDPSTGETNHIPDDSLCEDSSMCTVGACSENGCIQTNICPGDFTFTQGGWGTEPHGFNPGTVRESCFEELGISEVSPFVVGDVINNSIKFTGSNAVQNFLPSGGTPDILTQDHEDPTGKTEAGVFAGQTTALKLNVECSQIVFDDSPWDGTVGIFEVVGGGICQGFTVSEVLAAAEEVLGGNESAVPNAGSVAQLNECVSTINECFVDGGGCIFLVEP
jgi:hypothetical protein